MLVILKVSPEKSRTTTCHTSHVKRTRRCALWRRDGFFTKQLSTASIDCIPHKCQLFAVRYKVSGRLAVHTQSVFGAEAALYEYYSSL